MFLYHHIHTTLFKDSTHQGNMGPYNIIGNTHERIWYNPLKPSSNTYFTLFITYPELHRKPHCFLSSNHLNFNTIQMYNRLTYPDAKYKTSTKIQQFQVITLSNNMHMGQLNYFNSPTLLCAGNHCCLATSDLLG